MCIFRSGRIFIERKCGKYGLFIKAWESTAKKVRQRTKPEQKKKLNEENAIHSRTIEVKQSRVRRHGFSVNSCNILWPAFPGRALFCLIRNTKANNGKLSKVNLNRN